MKKHLPKPASARRMVLPAATAADIMTPNALSIREMATIREAVGFLTDKGFSAAPVIDVRGRPVGVLSRADIVVHDREKVEHLSPVPACYSEAELTKALGETSPDGFQVEETDLTPVRDIMTPTVFAVSPDTPACTVVAEMLALKVHRLFVVGSDGVLVGVISALDVLRHLRPDQPSPEDR